MEKNTHLSDRIWQWVTRHAEGPYMLPWLLLIAFLDGCISPFATEIFIAALMVAHPKRWREYLVISIVGTTTGAAVGYFIGRFLFQFLGQGIIGVYHLQTAFLITQHLLHGHTFLIMALAPFTIVIPEKVFVYAAGFLSAHFIPFIAGYFLGRSIRLTVFTYLSGKYGKRVVQITEEYIFLIALAVLIMLIIYGIVHWHLLPL